jgi:hypothetical protein
VKQHAIGITALIVSVIALGLAAIPMIVWDQSPLTPQEREVEPPRAEPKSKFTIRIKKFSISFGGQPAEPDKDDAVRDDAADALQVRPAVVDHTAKWCKVSSISFALIGLVLGPIAWVREKQPPLSGTAMTICTIAIFWQYVVLGIAIGVAVVVVLLLISSLAQ